jgi:hypothetical protein
MAENETNFVQLERKGGSIYLPLIIMVFERIQYNLLIVIVTWIFLSGSNWIWCGIERKLNFEPGKVEFLILILNIETKIER